MRADDKILISHLYVVRKVEFNRPSFWRRVRLFWRGIRRQKFFSYTLEVVCPDAAHVRVGDLILGQGNTGWEVKQVHRDFPFKGNPLETILVLKGTKPFVHCDILGNAIVVAHRKHGNGGNDNGSTGRAGASRARA